MATPSSFSFILGLVFGAAAASFDNEDNKRNWSSKETKIQNALDKLFEGADGVTEKEVLVYLRGKQHSNQIRPRRDDCFTKQDVNRHERAKSTSFTGHDPIKSANTGSVSGGRARRWW